MEKSCPFKNDKCSSDCALYIDPKDLNEQVRNKLASLGVFDRQEGLCSYKHMSLCMGRYIFENNSSNFSR